MPARTHVESNDATGSPLKQKLPRSAITEVRLYISTRIKPSSAGTTCGHCPRRFSFGLRPKWAVLQCNEWSRECNRALFPDRTENPMQTELDPLRNNRVRTPWQIATRRLPYLHKTS